MDRSWVGGNGARFTRRRVVGAAATAGGAAMGVSLLSACSPSGAGPSNAAPPAGTCAEKMEIWSAFGSGTVVNVTEKLTPL